MKYFVYQTSSMKNMEYDTNEVIKTVENYIVDNEKLDGTEKNMEEREKVKELKNDYLIGGLTKINVKEIDIKQILDYMYSLKTKNLNNKEDLVKVNNIFSSIQKQLIRDNEFSAFSVSNGNLKQMRGDTDQDDSVTDFNKNVINETQSMNHLKNRSPYKQNNSRKYFQPNNSNNISDSTGNSYNVQNQNSFSSSNVSNDSYQNRNKPKLFYEDYKNTAHTEENSVFSRKDSRQNTRKPSLYNLSSLNAGLENQNFKRKGSQQGIDETQIIGYIQKI